LHKVSHTLIAGVDPAIAIGPELLLRDSCRGRGLGNSLRCVRAISRIVVLLEYANRRSRVSDAMPLWKALLGKEAQRGLEQTYGVASAARVVQPLGATTSVRVEY
jgi:hypothetical protein